LIKKTHSPFSKFANIKTQRQLALCFYTPKRACSEPHPALIFAENISFQGQ
jgi:hypothetical protein